LPLPSSEALAPRWKCHHWANTQINFPEIAGERNTLGLISPNPNALGIPGAGDGWLIMGIIVRVIRFQSLFKTYQDYGLNVQDPLCGVVGTDTKIKVILERDADEVSDRVLRFLSQFLGFGLFITGRLGGVSGVNSDTY
jgi:hypothetical protein